MATRRARIKAVAALPFRRKNGDNKSDQIPNGESSEKQHVENTSEKPKESTSIKQQYVEDTAEKLEANTPEKQTGNLTEKQLHITPEKQSDKTRENQSEKATEKQSEKNAESRRARIKSVVALPTRRKHAGNKSGNALEEVNEDIAEKYKANQTVIQINSDTEKQIKRTSENQIENSISTLIEDTADNINKKGKQSENDKYATNTATVQDDYNPPSIPESITDETVDGIVPLKPARSAPKPLDLLKNEIISENAEVLFDPIVPLPSPSKVRPKLRPVPRLGPLRRNSIQGSASESEDENRRVLLGGGAPTPTPIRQRHDSHTSHVTQQSGSHRKVNRVRNDSVCSSVSQATPAPTVSSPLKEKMVKARRDENSRRIAAMRRRREAIQRDKLTMYDLIYYNPTSNPMVIDKDELKAQALNMKDEAERKEQVAQESEDSADDGKDNGKDAAPVPQLKLGPNGEIVLDEKSLVIKQSNDRKLSKNVIREGAWGGRVGRYHRNNRSKDWTAPETVRFYRALAALGTDFSLMVSLFPDRKRRDLKVKFKKEERVNPAQIDKALRRPTTWDIVHLEKEFTEQRQEEVRTAERDKERLVECKRQGRERAKKAKEMNVRHSHGAKAIGHVVEPCTRKLTDGLLTADEFLQKALEVKRTGRKKKIENEIQHVTPNTQKETDPLVDKNQSGNTETSNIEHMPTISRINPVQRSIIRGSPTTVTTNIESGSLVLLTVNDPSSPSKKVVQTYVSNRDGCLTPVALPSTLLNSVVGYMKNGTPIRNSPVVSSPSSTISQESRTSSVIQLNPSPRKRIRHSSYTITQL